MIRVVATNYAESPLWFLSDDSVFGVSINAIGVNGLPLLSRYTVNPALPTCQDFVVLAPGQTIALERVVPPDGLSEFSVGEKVRIQARYLDPVSVISEERRHVLRVIHAVKSNIIEIEVTE